MRQQFVLRTEAGIIVARGVLASFGTLAREWGYRWKSVRGYLFNGYYVNAEGDVLYPDVRTVNR